MIFRSVAATEGDKVGEDEDEEEDEDDEDEDEDEEDEDDEDDEASLSISSRFTRRHSKTTDMRESVGYLSPSRAVVASAQGASTEHKSSASFHSSLVRSISAWSRTSCTYWRVS